MLPAKKALEGFANDLSRKELDKRQYQAFLKAMEFFEKAWSEQNDNL
jgi:hypothetical protein